MATRNTLQKQRSIQMDDETYALLVGAAEQRNISRAAIIRELIHAEYGGDRAPDVEPTPESRHPSPAKHAAPQRAGAAPRKDAGAKDGGPTATRPEDLLPDTRADTFDVSGGRVRTRRSRPKMGEIEL